MLEQRYAKMLRSKMNKLSKDRRQVLQMAETERESRENSAQTEFYPALEDFLDYVDVPADKFSGPRKVLVSLDLLRGLIGLAAGALSYEEQYYRDRYPDLKRAAETGEIADLKMHFISHGFFERRHACAQQAAPVDEEWYLSKYPDVAKGLAEGRVSSVTDHYLTTGRREGRLPAGDMSEAMMALISALHPTDG
jgi:hypothetical protein